ncbi:MAG TPA: hypothetical protein DCS01_06030 [Idiomarina abyssalis]|jgi:hypothetical protein|uniref:hypothetical protein n=1 Tax=Idiomarina TaxID=135575 RepID=UPI000C480A89|nr:MULTISPECIES: hypothetical protein [Idiomarina]MAB20741.1 hypothetical protein [Idiomarina sp.]MBE92399.1 hypothetical protein [Idiomarina sp.]MBH95114.1 hypothetical protein [Idiomarina sp.]HAS14841.1 hypothetical protein [Idiomarina abyssalis]|tara:strand:+ start:1885 stop:2439 length:555 start_codon:yes stop_codon:yes gene_type:complete
MSNDEGKPLTSEHIFKKFLWRHSIAVGASMEKFTTWTVTGCAALMALTVSNLESIASIIFVPSLKFSIVLFVLSLLFGIASKMLGMALQSGVSLLIDMEDQLSSEAGKGVMNSMNIEPRQFVYDVADAYWWPLSVLMKKSGEAGIKDYLSADKRLVKMFCLQLYTNLVHILLAASAVLMVTFCL